MDIGGTAEVVGLALYQGASLLGVLDDLLGGVDDLCVGGVALGLAEVDMNEFESSVDTGLGRLHARAVVEIDVHLDSILMNIVVDHAADIG